MEDIIKAIRPTPVTTDWLMERIVQIGSASDVNDLFMRCLTWDIGRYEPDTVVGVGKIPQSAVNFFMDSSLISMFVIVTKCGDQKTSMLRYLFFLLKKHWETKLFQFILQSRKNINEQNYTERQNVIFDGSEQPMTVPESVLQNMTPQEKKREAEIVSIDKKAPLYTNEWLQVKQYRKELMNQLKELKPYVSSWRKPQEIDTLINEFGMFLQNTMHLNTSAIIYSELKNAFVDIIENTETLVGSQGNGADPLILKYNRPDTREPKIISNINGKLFRYLRQGYLDRWYAWASQWWLTNKHTKWFTNLQRMSRSDDHDLIKRGIEMALIDESACGSSRYCMYGLVSLNYPSLRYVRSFRFNDPWYAPPEYMEKDISVECTVKITTNSTPDTIRQHLLMVKEYTKQLNVMLYTTNGAHVSFCLIHKINIYIENIWGSCISIASLREQILRQHNLVGPLTRYVKEETRILTYCALMLVTLSHGIPLYVSMGWETVLDQWYKIIKENAKVHKRSMADKHCFWLARKSNNGIVLNQPLLYALFVRLLNHAFTPDKKIAQGDMGDGYMKYLKKHYSEMKEEGRIGSGKVKPKTVPKSWSPYASRFTAKLQKETSSKNADFLVKNQESYKEDLNKYETQKAEIQSRLDNIMNNRDFRAELIQARQTIERKVREIEQTQATIRDFETKLREEIRNPSLTIPMLRNVQRDLQDKISKSTERIETLEGDIIIIEKQMESILDEEEEAKKQIRTIRDELSNLIPPSLDNPMYVLEPRPSWNKDTYAPKINEEVLSLFTEEEKQVLNLKEYEWMYAQRLRFVSEYYCPESIEKLVEKFRIRFQDWTGESNISINI